MQWALGDFRAALLQGNSNWGVRKEKGASWCRYGAPFTRGRLGAGLSGLIQTTGGKSPLFHCRSWRFGERGARCPQLLELTAFHRKRWTSRTKPRVVPTRSGRCDLIVAAPGGGTPLMS